MKEFLPVLKKSPLFSGIEEAEIEAMTGCLGAETRTYQKDELVYRFGDTVESVGLVLTGKVYIVREDFWGNRNIIADVWPGDLFGESYAFLPGELLRVSAVAAEASAVMMIDARHMLEICSSACRFHTRLVQNMLAESAKKNLALTRKLSHMSKRSTREKLLSYLSGQSLAAGCDQFEIPFNRQQLADYLCVDRSAMSSELCKMRDEGLLTFDKNRFQLKDGFSE